MYIVAGIVGGTIVILVIWDILLTTLRLKGGGFLSFPFASALWKMVRSHPCIIGKHGLLADASFVILLVSMLIWAIFLWLGWTLIFTGSEQAVLDTQTMQPADIGARAYFAGYTLITLGIGDYRPGSVWWQMMTVIASANGFFFITLIVSYVIALIAAITGKHLFASYVTGLGCTPSDLLIQSWNGKDFGLLTQHLISLTPMVIALEQQHLAYPIIHCVHSPQRSIASAPSIAVLSEALMLLEHGVAPERRPDPTAIYPLRAAVSIFVQTLDASFIVASPEPPPFPKLMLLRRHGIPTVSDEEFHKAAARLDKERRLLRAQVEHDGWSWTDVIGSEDAGLSLAGEEGA